MSVPKSKLYITVAEYLEGERDGTIRHEYVDGQVYAVAGSSDRHNRLSGNIYTRLLTHLDGNNCEPFMSDMKVMVDPIVFYYPDVVVTCDDPVLNSYYRAAPSLVIEVLLPSTERIDRGEKLFAYRRVPSLQEYVLVSQNSLRVEVYRRQSGDEWTHDIFTNADDEIYFASVNLTISLREIYRNVRFTEN